MKHAKGIAVAVGLVALAAGCKKDDAATRAKKGAAAKNFWPEAPRPATTTGKRALAYQPANIKGYAIAIQAGTLPDAEVSIDVRMDLTLEFVDGDTPTSRKGMMRRMSMDMDAAGQSMDMSFDGNEIRVESGGEPPVTIKRGDPGMELTVEELADQPIALLDFRPDGTVVPTSTGDALDLDNSLDSALILFPDLPTGEIEAGHEWTVKRMAQLANNMGSVEVTYAFEYAGDGPCPSSPGTCAHLTFTAGSDNVSIETQGHKGTVTYGFAGKVFLNDKGAIDESRVRMDIDATIAGTKLPMGGVFTVKPAN